MQIGIDVGATKIEYILLHENGEETNRSRIDCPKDYSSIIKCIKDIVIKLEKNINRELPVGVCHPGIHSIQTGLIKNSPNCDWINNKPFQKDLRNAIGREVFCENDANCFTLSESIDGSGKHYKIVFGIILGSGVGGGLVIDKKIVTGPNGITGEWGHNQLPRLNLSELKNKTNLRDGEIESHLSGLSLSKIFKDQFKKNLTADKIFDLYRKHDIDAEKIIDKYKENLAISLSSIVNILDPDAFIFGGGLSNEIDFFGEIRSKIKKYVAGGEYEGVFLKPKFGDASGVRGAAKLGRATNY
tara:strand:- start:510 stop:1409 length:900 start_codon:yes stop_codon:yes gene_type:complete